MQIGQHVVYVGKVKNFRVCAPLVKGKVYTVRSMFTAKDGVPCIRVAEVVNATGRSGVEKGYMRKSFRPLDTKRLDQFRQFLADKPVKADA